MRLRWEIVTRQRTEYEMPELHTSVYVSLY